MSDAIERALAALKKSGVVIIVDDMSQEISGCLMMDAGKVSPADVCLLVNVGRGVICAAMWDSHLRELGLTLMGADGTHPLGPTHSAHVLAPELAVSVDARNGITTGISAADRALTLNALFKTKDPKMDLVMPGHIFPLRARSGGVLIRSGMAEAALDLLNLLPTPPGADGRKVAALMHCLSSNGELLDFAGLSGLAAEKSFPIIRISEIIGHRMRTESLIEVLAESKLPSAYAGEFKAIAFRSLVDQAEHLALVMGEIDQRNIEDRSATILTRIQAEHRLSDLLGAGIPSRRIIAGALQKIAIDKRGVFIYLRHPRKGLLKDDVASLAGENKPGMQMDLREFGTGVQILAHLGVKRISLLSNSNRNIPGLSAFDIEIVDRVPFSPAKDLFPAESCANL